MPPEFHPFFLNMFLKQFFGPGEEGSSGGQTEDQRGANIEKGRKMYVWTSVYRISWGYASCLFLFMYILYVQNPWCIMDIHYHGGLVNNLYLMEPAGQRVIGIRIPQKCGAKELRIEFMNDMTTWNCAMDDFPTLSIIYRLRINIIQSSPTLSTFGQYIIPFHFFSNLEVLDMKWYRFGACMGSDMQSTQNGGPSFDPVLKA